MWCKQSTGQTGNVSVEMFITACCWEYPPLLSVPRTLNISFSISITLLISQSSSYTSMCLYIDLIEHIVEKVLRNPLRALFLSSQQSLLAFLKPSNPFITFLLFLFALFFLTVNYCISPPTSVTVFIQLLLCFSPYLLLLFASSQSSCFPVQPSCTS